MFCSSLSYCDLRESVLLLTNFVLIPLSSETSLVYNSFLAILLLKTSLRVLISTATTSKLFTSNLRTPKSKLFKSFVI